MKKYRLLVLSFVFLGILLGSFHHHNILIDDDCPICIVQNNLDSSADIVVTPSLNNIFLEYLAITQSQYIYTFKNNLEKLSRAPPKYS